jgi:hypothetical protein
VEPRRQVRGIAAGVVDVDLDAELGYGHRPQEIGRQPRDMHQTLLRHGTLDRTDH